VWDFGAGLWLTRPSQLEAWDSRVPRCRTTISVREVCRETLALRVGNRWRSGPHELNRISDPPSLELDSADHRSPSVKFIPRPRSERDQLRKNTETWASHSTRCAVPPKITDVPSSKNIRENCFDNWGRRTKVRINKGRAVLNRRKTCQRS
jgi:hypothetical protein